MASMVNPLDLLNAALSTDLAATIFVVGFYVAISALLLGLPLLVLVSIATSLWKNE